MIKLKALIILQIMTMFFFACSMNYEDAKLAEELAEDIPSTILQNAVFSKVKNGYLASRIKAEEIRSFKNSNESEILKADFAEYNESGEVIAQGSADRMKYHFKTEDAELEGNIRGSSSRDNIGIEADSLKWKKEDKQITSNPDDFVTIKSESSTIRGTGFSANTGKKSFSFKGPVSGFYEDEAEEDQELQGSSGEGSVSAEDQSAEGKESNEISFAQALQEVKEKIKQELEKHKQEASSVIQEDENKEKNRENQLIPNQDDVNVE